MSANPQPTNLQMRAGRVRLQILLETVIAAPTVQICDTTGDFEALRPWLLRDNLDAICVLPRPDGRWVVSVWLRHAPPGLRKTFGTPAHQAMETALGAELAAADLLAMVLRIEQLTVASPDTPIAVTAPEEAFFLYGYAIPVPPERIEAQRAHFRELGFLDRSDARQLARASLETVMRDLFPNGFTPEAMVALSPWKGDRFYKVLVGAACLGLWSHPPSPDREATREEHLAWSKQRALEYVDFGELSQALAQFEADLLTHPDTARNRAPEAAVKLRAQGRLKTPDEVRSFIESVM